MLPSEDIEDLNNIQRASSFIENYDFKNIIKKYDLEDYIISIVFKNKNEVRVLSKINLKNSLKVNSQTFKITNLNNEKDLMLILEKLKTTYENYWKKNNEINTSIKLPLTVSINSTEYDKILELEKMLNENDLISDFYILKFNNQNTYYKIIYNGSPNIFFNDMNKGNIKLVIENNIWIIK